MVRFLFVYRENQAGREVVPGDGGFRGSKWDHCEAGFYTMPEAEKSMKLWEKCGFSAGANILPTTVRPADAATGELLSWELFAIMPVG
jgi:hypothetical protein